MRPHRAQGIERATRYTTRRIAVLLVRVPHRVSVGATIRQPASVTVDAAVAWSSALTTRIEHVAMVAVRRAELVS
jgi:hypothetical protein